MLEFLYLRRHVLRSTGLVLLAAGIALAIALDALAGLVVIGVAALPLAAAQPLLLAHLRSRQARRRAPHNGHGADADDLDLPQR